MPGRHTDSRQLVVDTHPSPICPGRWGWAIWKDLAWEDQVRIATSVSELARNVFNYAQGGRVEFSIAEVDGQQVLEMTPPAGSCAPDVEPGGAQVEVLLDGSGIGIAVIDSGLEKSEDLSGGRADQFFDDRQYAAYTALGRELGRAAVTAMGAFDVTSVNSAMPEAIGTTRAVEA